MVHEHGGHNDPANGQQAKACAVAGRCQGQPAGMPKPSVATNRAVAMPANAARFRATPATSKPNSTTMGEAAKSVEASGEPSGS